MVTVTHTESHAPTVPVGPRVTGLGHGPALSQPGVFSSLHAVVKFCSRLALFMSVRQSLTSLSAVGSEPNLRIRFGHPPQTGSSHTWLTVAVSTAVSDMSALLSEVAVTRIVSTSPQTACSSIVTSTFTVVVRPDPTSIPSLGGVTIQPRLLVPLITIVSV